MPKSFCYSGDCEIIETGFRLEVYYVCRKCKQEVEKGLKERVEEYKELQKLREEQKKKDEEDSRSTIFEFLDFPYD